jgi:hypothetical protein
MIPPVLDYTTIDIEHEMGRLRQIYQNIPFEEFLFVAAQDILTERWKIHDAHATEETNHTVSGVGTESGDAHPRDTQGVKVGGIDSARDRVGAND